MIRVLHPEIPPQGEVTLAAEESHHLVRVRRAGPGACLELLDGTGTRARGRLLDARPKAARVEIAAVEHHPRPPFRLVLLQAVPKGRTMEGIVQRATELGVEAVVPLLTEHCEVQLAPERAAQKVAKWTTTADEALKQCGNPWRPEIARPVGLAAALAQLPPLGTGLVASLQPPVSTVRAALAPLAPTGGGRPTVALAVGPEGDFSPAEYDLFQAAGWRSVTLGPLVLRAETASCAFVAVALQELRERLGT